MSYEELQWLRQELMEALHHYALSDAGNPTERCEVISELITTLNNITMQVLEIEENSAELTHNKGKLS